MTPWWRVNIFWRGPCHALDCFGISSGFEKAERQSLKSNKVSVLYMATEGEKDECWTYVVTLSHLKFKRPINCCNKDRYRPQLHVRDLNDTVKNICNPSNLLTCLVYGILLLTISRVVQNNNNNNLPSSVKRSKGISEKNFFCRIFIKWNNPVINIDLFTNYQRLL